MRRRILDLVGALVVAVVAVTALVPTVARAADVLDVYRMYNRYTGEHLYTTSKVEKDKMAVDGWTYEGIGWQAPAKSDKPVYRLYNPYVPGGDHHYTMDANEYHTLQTKGWRGEDVAFYSAPEYPDGDPILRQYNPFAVTGIHNYTASRAERDVLTDFNDKDFGLTPDGSYVPYAWLNEGIAWYGVKGSTGEDYDARPCNHIIVRQRYVDQNGKKWPQCIICGQLFSTLA